MFNIMQKSLPSVMQHSFSQVPRARIPRSQFKRNFEHKTTFNADYLVPFYWDEVYPGDTANCRFSSIVRMVTPETPFMDNLYIDTFFFFVPNRLVQDNWQKLMGEQENPGDSIDYATPKVTSPVGGYVDPADWSAPTAAELSGALYDYLGYPTRVAGYEATNYLARGYNLIWNNWFRDENLQDSVVVDKDDGPDTYTDYKLLKRGKRHDYFTSCLPWLQKGLAEDLPLGTSAPITGIGLTGTNGSFSGVKESDGSTNNYTVGGNASYVVMEADGTNGYPTIMADLTAASAATIGQLYESFAIQDLLQTDARGGTRYVELINAHFGVTSPDFRMQRPEYLGGSSVPFIVSPLAQTSQTATTELGTLAATAAASMNGIGFIKSFVEHGFVIGMLCVRADLTYQQGLHRSLMRDTRYDFYFPALANLGEQEVYNIEIYAQGTSADQDIFGYQERWSEMRYGRSVISGRMRSNHPTSLDVWHLSEEFGSLPALNASFIEQNTPVDRVVAVTSEPQFKADIYGQNTWTRPMPLYSVPGLMNRF
jgi:hypothetical protein